MKVKKLLLDEALFDEYKDGKVTTVSTPDYDDDFSFDTEGISSEHMEDAPEGPKAGSDTGVADLLISAINDEFEAIQFYNSLIATLRAESVQNLEYNDFISVIEEINNEENLHVGQLQKLLERLSPNAESIKVGNKEAAMQLSFANGKMPVQSWDTPSASNSNPNPNAIDDTCSLIDVDDEM